MWAWCIDVLVWGVVFIEWWVLCFGFYDIIFISILVVRLAVVVGCGGGLWGS